MLLRSPLHRFAGRRRLLLHLDGRDVLLTYHQDDGGELTVLASGAETWWRGLVVSAADGEQAEGEDAGIAVEVTVRSTRHRGRLRFLSGDELDAALIPYLQANPAAWTLLGVQPNATEDDVADAAQGAGVGRITLLG